MVGVMQCVRAAVQVATTIPVLVVIDECLFSLCRVPDRSMMPTLQDDVDSLVFVDKFNLRRWLSSNVWDSQLRGEVVYLNSPSDPDTFLMKRVIGLPGDWISVPSEQELIHIPKGQCWVEGDDKATNVPMPSGSFTAGLVPFGLIHGQVTGVVWPPRKVHRKIDLRRTFHIGK